MDLNDLYQELIIDHGMNPRHCHKLENASVQASGFNPLCGDKVELYLNIEDGTIKHASFQGKGCAISTASASLMIESILNKPVLEVEELFKQFVNIMTTDTPFSEDFGKLIAFTGVKVFPARVKCATLAWHTLESALQKESAQIPRHMPEISIEVS
jgi:nitrogen fixation protein NifU and related proteins